jgi:hypothetical protein
MPTKHRGVTVAAAILSTVNPRFVIVAPRGAAWARNPRGKPALRPAAKAATDPEAVTAFVCQLTKR